MCFVGFLQWLPNHYNLRLKYLKTVVFNDKIAQHTKIYSHQSLFLSFFVIKNIWLAL